MMEKQSKQSTVTLEIGSPISSWYIPIKQCFDTFVACMLLVVAIPIILLAVIAVKIDSHGPIFFKQERLGFVGSRLQLVKIRTMTTDAEKNGAQWAQSNDPRITRVGRFLRKTRVDELPQLINVVRGEMSLIGPRPERPEFTEQFAKQYPGFEHRLRIKPGLSGYAQVHGGYDLDPGQKAELDNFYIDHFGPIIDGHIFWATIMTVVTGKGAR